MQFVVLEICDDVPSVNLITNDIMVARNRLAEEKTFNVGVYSIC